MGGIVEDILSSENIYYQRVTDEKGHKLLAVDYVNKEDFLYMVVDLTNVRLRLIDKTPERVKIDEVTIKGIGSTVGTRLPNNVRGVVKNMLGES